MKYSQFFGHTVKEVPQDIVADSHRLLYQGGFIRQIAAGRYAFLPLGFRVCQKIEKIIDQEMTGLGSQRVHTPTLHPIEFWTATSRDKAFGEEMLTVADRHGATFAVGATAEGLMVELVKKFKPSYRDLPILIHQFVQKFRDEKRPRGGLLRLREFMMKDAYSFCATEKDLLFWYQKFYDAYLRIAARLKIKAIPVLADSGAIGGDYCHEFMVLSQNGEDEVVLCEAGDYAANREKAESCFTAFPQDKKRGELKAVLGQGIVGVASLAKFLKIPVTQTTKTLIYQADDKVVAACIRGDYEINETKLAQYLNTHHLALASKDLVKEMTGAEVGYAGPLDLPEEVEIVWDLTTADRVNFEAGANKTNYHYLNVNFDRDVKVPAQLADIRKVRTGDNCSRCQKGQLSIKKAIEYGHIFKQDHFYTSPMKGDFVDQDGEIKPMWMGAYGIGLDRAMAVVVETHHDDRGIIWPESVAPFRVWLVEIPGPNPEVGKQAEKVYKQLCQAGIEVLYDDRGRVSSGVKFADADLVGCPIRIVVSEKSLTNHKLEWKRRTDPNSELLSYKEVEQRLIRS